MDRQDIDALLIGALYGELTPADEARLAAHLESHPTDRGALDDLKRARAAVRESRIFELQLDPPQAVSALLLQEAHRRAPKHVATDNGDRKESWFYRFTRVFMAHPAMAAAAMLVLVVGVAGTLYVKKGGAEFADRQAPTLTEGKRSDELAISAEQGAGSAAAMPQAVPAPSAADPGLAEPLDDRAEGKVGGGDDKFGVQLDDNAQRGRADSLAAKRDQAEQQAEKTKRQVESNRKSSGIVVTTPQPQPKDFESPRAKASGTKGSVASKGDFAGADSDGFASAPAADLAESTVSGAGGAAATGTATGTATVQRAPTRDAPAQAAPAAPPPPPTAVASTSPSSGAKQSAPGKAATPPVKPTTTAKKEAEKPTESKLEASPAPAPATNSALIAWAKAEHNATVSLANKGNCLAAAKRAVQVQNRAPEYYSQYMASDRALKNCQVYIAQEREAEAERANKTRATKRATTTDTK